MKTHIVSLLSAVMIAGIALPTANAVDEKKSEKKPAAKVKSSKKKRDTYPFRGSVGSVEAGKIVLKQKSGDRAIIVPKGARIQKVGADRKRTNIKLSDIKAGAYVSGLVKKVDGKETAVAVYERPKPEPRSKSKTKGKGKSKKKD